MTRRMKLLIAAGLGAALLAGGTAYAMQGDTAGQLRASGQAGEQRRAEPGGDQHFHSA